MLIERLAALPVIGRLVQIGAAFYRLPELRAQQAELARLTLDLNHRNHVLESDALPSLKQFVLGLNHRHHVLESDALPSLKQFVLELNHRHHVLESDAVPSLKQFVLELNHRNHVLENERLPALERQQTFEAKQLPTLLRTVSEINHRQVAADTDRENLVKSVPVALRRLTRAQQEIDRLLAQTKTESEETARALGVRLDASNEDVVRVAGAMAQANERLTAALARIEAVATEVQESAEATRRRLDDRPEATLTEGIQRRIDDLSGSAAYLLGRVEFVRRELMFELRYGARERQDGRDHVEVAARVVDADKFARARKASIRLNLGCGHIPLDGYLNVDRRELPGVDIVAEVDQLPFDKGEVDEIHSAHLLEHFPEEQLRRATLPYWANLIKPGGRFSAVVPDAEAMIREYANGGYPYEDFREVTFGAQDYDGDFHFNMFTPASLSALLAEAGFVDVDVIAAGRRNGRCYEFELRATKPSAAKARRAEARTAAR